jgi:hypothetical protein
MQYFVSRTTYNTETYLIMNYTSFTIKLRVMNDSSDSDMQQLKDSSALVQYFTPSPLLGYPSHLSKPMECQMPRAVNKITCGHLKETALLCQLFNNSRPIAPHFIIL